MKLQDACESFLSHCRSAISLSEHTLRAYTFDLLDFQNHAKRETDLVSLDKENLRQFIRHLREERKLKETTIKRRIACLKLLFRWAKQDGMIADNPFDNLHERIRLPKRLPRALERCHIASLRKAIAPSDGRCNFDELSRKTAIQLLLDTGIRVGKLASARIDDLSLSDRCLKIHGKGNRQRLVYLLSAPLYRCLDHYLSKRQKINAQNSKLFVTGAGLDLTPQRVRASLHQIASSAGINKTITPHMLRHTCATQWLEAGLDIRYVQKLLGHQSISTTEIYTHVSDQGLREALLRAMGGK